MNRKIEKVKKIILPILIHHGVSRAGLFGSIVRGELRKKSDIDVLVEIRQDISLFDFVGIKLELEDALKRKVDLVEYETIKPLITDSILKEEIRII